MPEIPRTKFNSPWTVAVIEAALNDVSSAKGSSESLTAALNAMRAEINSLSGGVHLKGAVDYYADLPASPSEGDAYTVRYQGSSGTDPLGIEYAWATYQGTPQWIPIGVDPSVFAKATDEAEDRAALGEVINGGAAGTKNLLNANGSFHRDTNGWINGTGAANGIDCNIPAGYYYLTVTVDGNIPDGSIAQLQVMYEDDTIVSITNLVRLVSNSSSHVQIQLTKNVIKADIYFTGAPATIKNIMLCPKTLYDVNPDFEPYAPSKTNVEITPALVELVDGGAKNICNMSSSVFYTKTYDGVTVTRNDDVISVSDTSGNVTNNYFNVYVFGTDQYHPSLTIPPGDWVAIINGSGTGSDKLWLGLALDGSAIQGTIGEPFEFTVPVSSSSNLLRLYVKPSTAYDCTLKIMICPKSLWDVSHAYQPYRPSWQEMYAGGFQSIMTSLVDNLNVTFIDKANSRLNVYKYGKICFADISLKTNSSSLTGADTITTTSFPSEIRPTSTIYASLTARDAGSWALSNLVAATVSIDANGVAILRTGTAHSSAEYITGYISWLAST